MDDGMWASLRLECLKLAIDRGIQGADAVRDGRLYADFVLGTRDAAIIRAATELADKIAA